MATKSDEMYKQFLEILSENVHPSLKYIKIVSLIAESVFDVNKIPNDRNLRMNPDSYRKSVLWNEYLEYINKENDDPVPTTSTGAQHVSDQCRNQNHHFHRGQSCHGG